MCLQMKEENILIENFHYNSIKKPDDGSVTYFDFEKDFVEDNARCIPMIVRFKLDACGIKLKLSEWSKMEFDERNKLCELACNNDQEFQQYRRYCQQIIFNRTGKEATDLAVEQNPAWANTNELPFLLAEKLKEFSWLISLRRWQLLSNLQRFVLIKLSKPGHENKNFPKAVKEFGLV